MIELWRVGEPNSRGKIFVARWCKSLGNPRVSGNDKSLRRSWIERRLCACHVGLDLIIFFPPGHDDIPSQTGIDGQVASCAPTVLRIEPGIPVSQIERLSGGLRIVARSSDEEIGVGRTSLGAVDIEGAIESGVRVLVDLVGVELSAELQGVGAERLGEAVGEEPGVIDLREVGDRNAHHEGWERNVLYTLELRCLDEDASRSRAGEALRGQADAETAFRLADDVVVAEIAGMELIDDAGTDELGVAKREELRLADEESVEAGNAGPGHGAGRGVIEAIVVDEVVAGKLAEAGVAIDAKGALVVADGLRLGGGRELVGAYVGGRNVLQEVFTGSGPGGLRDDQIGEDALGCGG